ncbi:MAG: patatin-like phospholipase family protein [Deltaproteobacteria bacterium]|nr:patatin-like phospholipase family protein [Deltaproteobacteria bacterium]
MKKIVLLLIATTLLACSSRETKTSPSEEGKIDSGKLKIALVLDGIGVHGFSGVGVLRILEKARIPLHLIVGNNMGALIGALYAESQNSFSVEWDASQLELSDYFSTSFFGGTSLAHASLEPFQRFIQKKIKRKKIEDLDVEFLSMTTNLRNGETFIFDKGDLNQAILASAAIPGFFNPQKMSGKILVTGSLTEGSGIRVARQKNADIIIALDTRTSLDFAPLNDQKDIIFQSHLISRNRELTKDLEEADIIIQPALQKIKFNDFSKKREMMIAGQNATVEIIEKLSELIENNK